MVILVEPVNSLILPRLLHAVADNLILAESKLPQEPPCRSLHGHGGILWTIERIGSNESLVDTIESQIGGETTERQKSIGARAGDQPEIDGSDFLTGTDGYSCLCSPPFCQGVNSP